MTHVHLPGAGKSSFDLVDVEVLFRELDLGGDEEVVDLGCGAGYYTLALAERLVSGGRVTGIDLWKEGLAGLRAEASGRGLSSVKAVEADIRAPLPFDDATADLVFLATVFHDLTEQGQEVADRALAETVRVLRPAGRVAFVEFKTVEPPPGPPRAIRLSPAHVDVYAGRQGLERRSYADLGPYNYLLIYGRG